MQHKKRIIQDIRAIYNQNNSFFTTIGGFTDKEAIDWFRRRANTYGVIEYKELLKEIDAPDTKST